MSSNSTAPPAPDGALTDSYRAMLPGLSPQDAAQIDSYRSNIQRHDEALDLVNKVSDLTSEFADLDARKEVYKTSKKRMPSQLLARYKASKVALDSAEKTLGQILSGIGVSRVEDLAGSRAMMVGVLEETIASLQLSDDPKPAAKHGDGNTDADADGEVEDEDVPRPSSPLSSVPDGEGSDAENPFTAAQPQGQVEKETQSAAGEAAVEGQVIQDLDSEGEESDGHVKIEDDSAVEDGDEGDKLAGPHVDDDSTEDDSDAESVVNVKVEKDAGVEDGVDVKFAALDADESDDGATDELARLKRLRDAASKKSRAKASRRILIVDEDSDVEDKTVVKVKIEKDLDPEEAEEAELRAKLLAIAERKALKAKQVDAKKATKQVETKAPAKPAHTKVVKVASTKTAGEVQKAVKRKADVIEIDNDSDEEHEQDERKFGIAHRVCVHNYLTHNVGFGTRIKTRARLDQTFAPEAATLSRVLTLSVLIKGGGAGTTRCHWHCQNDHVSKYNDLAPDKISTKPGARRIFEVTGIPYAYSKKIRASKKSLAKISCGVNSLNITKLPSNDPKPAVMKPVVNSMDEKELLTFFKKRGGRYFLHCGCDLEHVLLDFYFWKVAPPLVSASTGDIKHLGGPLDPRTRAYFYSAITATGDAPSKRLRPKLRESVTIQHNTIVTSRPSEVLSSIGI